MFIFINKAYYSRVIAKMSLQSSTLQQTRLVYPSIHWSGSILSLQLSQISKDVSLITIKIARASTLPSKIFARAVWTCWKDRCRRKNKYQQYYNTLSKKALHELESKTSLSGVIQYLIRNHLIIKWIYVKKPARDQKTFSSSDFNRPSIVF
jgi:hypothetical protein